MFSFGIVPGNIGLVFLFELGNRAESYVIPEFFVICAMAPFNLAVLRRLPRTYEEMDNVTLVAFNIEHMQPRR